MSAQKQNSIPSPDRFAGGGHGDTEHDRIEIARKIFIINLFAFIGAAYLVVFGVNSLRIGQSGLGIALIVAGILAFGNYFFLKRTGDHRVAAHMMVGIVMSLFAILIIGGGVEHTGPLWCYVFAPIILFVYGSRLGLIPIAAMLVLAGAVFFLPNLPSGVAQYSSVFETRFLASFIAVSVMSYVYEISRDQAHQRLAVLGGKLYAAACTDTLTGLLNRRAMLDILRDEDSRARRSGRPYTILLADLDHFKKINDTQGHDCGDRVLVETAKGISQLLREADAVSRWGGEEFLILLPETDSEAAETVAEKIRSYIDDMRIGCDSDAPTGLTVSIGSVTADHRHSIDQYITEADRNLYRAKESGKNRCVMGNGFADE